MWEQHTLHSSLVSCSVECRWLWLDPVINTLPDLKRLTGLSLKAQRYSTTSDFMERLQQTAEQLAGLRSLEVVLQGKDDHRLQRDPEGPIISFAAAATGLTSLTLDLLNPGTSLVALSSLTGLQEMKLGGNVPAAVQQQLFGALRQLTTLMLLQQEEPVAAALEALEQLRTFNVTGRAAHLDEASTSAVLGHRKLEGVWVYSFHCGEEWAERVCYLKELGLSAIPPEMAATHFRHFPALPQLQLFRAVSVGHQAPVRWQGLYKLLLSSSRSIQKLIVGPCTEALPRSMPQLHTLSLVGAGQRMLGAACSMQAPALQTLVLNVQATGAFAAGQLLLDDVAWLAALPRLRLLSLRLPGLPEQERAALQAMLRPSVSLEWRAG